MSDRKIAKPVAAAIGAALAGSFAVVGTASADAGASPFAVTTLSAGYLLGAAEGTCGGDKNAEGSCGGDKGAEGSCGGAKGDKEDEGAKGAEGSCGGAHEEKDAEGKCGEGKCGGSV